MTSKRLLLFCYLFLAGTLTCKWALAAGEEGMFLELRVNQTSRGEFAVYRNAEGDFLLRLSDAPQLGLRSDIDLPLVRVEGESSSFVSLRALGASQLDFDGVNMVLNLELPAKLFEKTAIDLISPDTRSTLSSTSSSGFLNYRLADTAYANHASQRSLATELGLRFDAWLFLNQSLWRDDGYMARYLTQLVYDRPADQQRLIAGDFTGLSGELGSVLPMGGLNFSKVYDMTPELITQPLAGFAGVASSPSTVEVRMGGVPVAVSQVNAGPYELQNLHQFIGASNVQVVVRDALGREQTYSFPFYYSDRSLREGLQEYSYSLGKIRINAGLADDHYEHTAFSAFHRFGYSDNLTLGARAEAAQDLGNAGVEASWRSNQWGLLTAGLSASNYQGQGGSAALLSYTYLQSRFGIRTVARSYSDHYAPLETLSSGFDKRGDYGLGLSWYPAVGTSINLDHTLTQTRSQDDTHLSSLGYFQSLGPASSLYATLLRTDYGSGASPVTALFVGWFYRFGGKYTASVNASRDEAGRQSIYTQFQKDIPYGEGLGYRVGWTNNQPQNSDDFNGYVQWNLPAASLSVDARTTPVLGQTGDYHEVAVAGSVAYAGKAWGFSRTINDSFAVVQLGVPLAGVRVTSNSQDIGVTNASGQVISPYLGSFYPSQIAIDDQQIPMQYTMGQNAYDVRPVYRSGVAVDFGMRRVHALEGVIRLRRGTQTPTADNLIVSLSRDGHVQQQFQVGREGYFYLDNISPGSYQGEIQTPEQSCHFQLQVPESDDIVFTLPKDLVCEYAP